jgi:phage tail-like protein
VSLLPLPAYRFHVMLKDSASLSAGSVGEVWQSAKILGGAALSMASGFSDCSGLEVTTEVLEYMEGGTNGFVHKLPTRTKMTDITLKRGLIFMSDLWIWVQQVMEGKYVRKDGFILIRTAAGVPAQLWEFHRGLPLKWSGPSLVASQNAIATESLTIAHEGLSNVGLDALKLGLDFTGLSRVL